MTCINKIKINLNIKSKILSILIFIYFKYIACRTRYCVTKFDMIKPMYNLLKLFTINMIYK